MADEAESDRKKRKRLTEDDRIAHGALFGLGGFAAGQVGANLLAPRDVLRVSRPTSRQQTAIRDIAARDGLPVERVTTGARGGPYYMPADRRVNVPTDRGEVIGHELGHALNLRDLSSLTGRDPGVLLSGLSRAGLYAAPWAGMAAYGAGGALRRHAWAVPLALSAPALLDEGLASIRGYGRYGRELGAGPGSVGNLARAFGTYLVSAAAPAAALYGLRRWHESRDQEAARKRKKPEMRKESMRREMVKEAIDRASTLKERSMYSDWDMICKKAAAYDELMYREMAKEAINWGAIANAGRGALKGVQGAGQKALSTGQKALSTGQKALSAGRGALSGAGGALADVQKGLTGAVAGMGNNALAGLQGAGRGALARLQALQGLGGDALARLKGLGGDALTRGGALAQKALDGGKDFAKAHRGLLQGVGMGAAGLGGGAAGYELGKRSSAGMSIEEARELVARLTR